MLIESLSVFNYRNIAEANLTFSPVLNCFVGGNGEGKTNLLDALYYLSLGHSSVCPTDADNIAHGSDCFMLSGRYRADGGVSSEIQCAVRRGRRRMFKVDASSYATFSEHIGRYPLVSVSPRDAALTDEGGEGRRRFLDGLLCQCSPAYLSAWQAYRRTLQQRNALLKDPEQASDDMLDVFDLSLTDYGQTLFAARRDAVEALLPTFHAVHRRLSEGASEEVSLSYVSRLSESPDLYALLRATRSRDRALGYTSRGIHRDDLLMTLSGHPLRREASQGQNKTFLLALKLAEARYLSAHRGERPMLLLDDIFDKLDATRVARFIRLVCDPAEGFGQVFLTDTNRNHLLDLLADAAPASALFSVRGGQISIS